MSALTGAEVKWTIRAAETDDALTAIGLSMTDATVRDVCFFDAPEEPAGGAAGGWELYRRGIQLRARYDPREADDGDTTVKLRPVDPAHVPGDWPADKDFKLEQELSGDTATISASLSQDEDSADIAAIVRGTRPLKKLLNQDQERFLAEARGSSQNFAALRLLGPILTWTWRLQPLRPGGRRLDVELWQIPGGRRVLEFSTKCTLADAVAVQTALRTFLASFDLSTSFDPAGQASKTSLAMQALHAAGGVSYARVLP